MSGREIQAGKAFVDLMKKDPEFNAGMARAQLKLRLFSHLCRHIVLHHGELLSPVIAVWTDFIRQREAIALEARKEMEEVRRQINDEWRRLSGEDAPNSIEDWEALARRVGIPTETILEGKWTPRAVEPIARGYFQSLRDQASRDTGLSLTPKDWWTLEKSATFYERHAGHKRAGARSKIRRACLDGKIPFKKKNGRFLIAAPLLAIYILESEVEADADAKRRDDEASSAWSVGIPLPPDFHRRFFFVVSVAASPFLSDRRFHFPFKGVSAHSNPSRPSAKPGRSASRDSGNATGAIMFSSSSPSAPAEIRRSHLSPARQRLAALLADIHFGRVERLNVVAGEPVIDDQVLAIRLVRITGTSTPRPPVSADPVLRKELVALFQHLDRLGNGRLRRIEVAYGLPQLLEQETNAA